MFLPFSWILGTSEWMPFDSNTPTDCFLQGLVGACAISVLCSLMRVYYFLQTCSDSETESKQRSSSPVNPLRGNWRTALQFWSLTLVLSLDAHGRGLYLLLLQCQFSLGCCFTCALVFLHQGAPHSSLNLFLAAAISWALASVSHSLWSHVARHYPLHSTEPYCGKCITLLTSGHTILTSLQRAVVLAFAFATVASFATVYDHFLSQKDALKFWTPLTLCYTMLVIYIQADQNRQTGAQALWHTAVLRLGALLVLMLTVGDWSDVLHILISFLGEAACLLPSQDLLQAVSREEEEETSPRKQEQISGRKTFEVKRKPTSDDS
ncbi:transmembrane protein 82-like isoform X2 [Hippoglossus hippoglossus]|uniref:transmembrane protein 82-like isoform X2 n=1 Tax=Hippoglossus hippoglossus TaxID=8267 RepID=UPI00148D765C|nr:transmembrane protein 82-like isoform X2 [Hippoglossus hippoglossus]